MTQISTLKTDKCVAVFGSSQAQEGNPDYDQALRLGELLASSGYTVLTGGYLGTMEAVSRGAAASGARVIGVTCQQIEDWRPNKVNAWVKDEICTPTLTERIVKMGETSHAAMALPGGPGTLTEISLIWNLLTIQALPPRPLILIGASWEKIFRQIFALQESYIQTDHRDLLHFAADVETAVRTLNAHFKRI